MQTLRDKRPSCSTVKKWCVSFHSKSFAILVTVFINILDQKNCRHSNHIQKRFIIQKHLDIQQQSVPCFESRHEKWHFDECPFFKEPNINSEYYNFLRRLKTAENGWQDDGRILGPWIQIRHTVYQILFYLTISYFQT